MALVHHAASGSSYAQGVIQQNQGIAPRPTPEPINAAMHMFQLKPSSKVTAVPHCRGASRPEQAGRAHHTTRCACAVHFSNVHVCALPAAAAVPIPGKPYSVGITRSGGSTAAAAPKRLCFPSCRQRGQQAGAHVHKPLQVPAAGVCISPTCGTRRDRQSHRGARAVGPAQWLPIRQATERPSRCQSASAAVGAKRATVPHRRLGRGRQVCSSTLRTRFSHSSLLFHLPAAVSH